MSIQMRRNSMSQTGPQRQGPDRPGQKNTLTTNLPLQLGLAPVSIVNIRPHTKLHLEHHDGSTIPLILW